MTAVPSPAPFNPGRLPRLAAFDLDYTCWDSYIEFYRHPLTRRQPTSINLVHDRQGQSLAFYPELPSIFLEFHRAGVHIAAASRTHATSEAMEALQELHIPGCRNEDAPSAHAESSISAIKLFGTLEIYPGSKISHFKEIHRKTAIPYDEMIFFDDEPRNREVETKLGVTFVLVKNGTTRKVVEKGLELWRKQHPDKE